MPWKSPEPGKRRRGEKRGQTEAGGSAHGGRGGCGDRQLGVRSAQGQGGTEDQGLGSEGEGHLMKSRNAQISVDTRPSRLLLSALVPKSKSLRGCGGHARVPEPIKGRLPLMGRSGTFRGALPRPPSRKAAACVAFVSLRPSAPLAVRSRLPLSRGGAEAPTL